MNPEIPYLTAGAIAVIGGTAKAKHFPPPGITGAVFGTIILVVLASASTGTKMEPLVRAVGMLVLLVAVLATVPKLGIKPLKVKK